MSELAGLFLNNLLPIFLAAGAGYALAYRVNLNPRTLSQVVLYIFAPCLIFSLLTRAQLKQGEMVSVALFSLGTILLTGALALTGGKLLRLPPRLLAGVLLASMFMNAGNYGMPVVMFAFGEQALAYASLFFVTSACTSYTLGVFIASRGSLSARQALINLLRIPMIYSLALALVFIYTGWPVPLPLERTIGLLGDASIPCMLVLLGMQLRAASWRGRVAPLALVTGVRLIAGPLIAAGLALAFNLHGPLRQAIILEAGMPAAVLNALLATEFDAEPSFVSAAVFLTTLLSPLTLTPLLAYLGA